MWSWMDFGEVLNRFWESWGKKKINRHLNDPGICRKPLPEEQHRDLWLQVRCAANLKNILHNILNAAEYSLDNISGYLST